jgi:hypothetical protein
VDGIDHGCGIRKKAKAAGVPVLTPREFYGDMDELLESAWFMPRYGQGAEAHIGDSSKPELMRESMLWLQGYYRHVLYGITKGRREPVPVKL